MTLNLCNGCPECRECGLKAVDVEVCTVCGAPFDTYYTALDGEKMCKECADDFVESLRVYL